MRPSSPLPTARCRRSPRRSRGAAPAASCASPPASPRPATAEGERLTARAARERRGELPFFGPNCYGFINFFDGAALWPDQVVGRAPRARRRAHLPERHHRAQSAVQRALAADRLRAHGGQPDAPRRRGPDRAARAPMSASAPSGSTSRASRTSARFARAAAQRARRRQAHRARQGGPHRGGQRARRARTPARWPARTRRSTPSAARPGSRAANRSQPCARR